MKMGRKKLTDDFEVQLMEFRKDIEYLKDGQKQQQNESNLRHAEIKTMIAEMESKFTSTLKDSLKGYVTLSQCKEYHIGGELKQEKKESGWKDKAIGVLIGIIASVITAIIIAKLNNWI